MKIKHTHSKNENAVQEILRSVEINWMKTVNKMYKDLGRLDWETWADLKPTMKPRYLNRKLLGHAIYLESDKEVTDTLLACFPLMEKARIKIDSFNFSPIVHQNYKKLTGLEEVEITGITQPVNFIASKKLKKITVKIPLINTTMDHVEPILTISEEIDTFKYSGGSLSNMSILLLNENPIRTMYLEHIIVENERLFTAFLSNLKTLRILKLNNSLTLQTCFFSNENNSIQNIKILHLSLHANLNEVYKNFTRCLQLSKLTLNFTDIRELTTTFESVINLPKLKEIILVNVKSPKTDEISLMEIEIMQILIEEWKIKFAEHNIKLTEHK